MRKTLANALAKVDAWMNRLYGWRLNPLYQSGSLVVVTLVVMLVTGLYLLLFYRIGAPAESVATITDQIWTGRWIRALHRYAADAAIVAAAVHALRMLAQGRSWGPRTLAWLSGLFLVFLLYVCGWTGYVMVWDGQGRLLATEGARLLDTLPIFSQPISRTFAGDAPLPSAFFFLNLFLHIAVPIGLAGCLWLHVSRVARPVLLPPRALLWGATLTLTALSVALPVPMYQEADLLALPGETVVDLFYAFWLPLAGWMSPGGLWITLLIVTGLLAAVPLLTRPAAQQRPQPSRVEPRFCTGCEQCYEDCPYDAIRMVQRDDGRDDLLANVNPDLCVSCGICAGSCAPMGVGPPLRTGRDQLAAVRSFLDDIGGDRPRIVVVGCDRSAARRVGPAGAAYYPVTCSGNLHTSLVEYLIRGGVGGVLVVACPPRDCWSREGTKWLEERLFNDREAELKDRVDRRRVRVTYAAAGEMRELAGALARFDRDVAALDQHAAEEHIDLELECEVPAPGPVP